MHSYIHEFDLTSIELSASEQTLNRNINAKKSEQYCPKDYHKSKHIAIVGISSPLSSSSSSSFDSYCSHDYSISSISSIEESTEEDQWFVDYPITAESLCWDILSRIGILNQSKGIDRNDDSIYDYNVDDLPFDVLILQSKKLNTTLTQLSKLLSSTQCNVTIVSNEMEMINQLVMKSFDFVLMNIDAMIFYGSESIRKATEHEVSFLSKRYHLHHHHNHHKKPSKLSSASSTSLYSSMDIHSSRCKHRNNNTNMTTFITSHVDPPTFIPKLMIPIRKTMKLQKIVAVDSGKRCYIPFSVQRLSKK